MSARRPTTLPEAVFRPLMTPTTPVLPMPGHDLVAAERPELVGDQAGGAMHLEADLRMLVNVAAPGRYLLVHGGDAIDDRHGDAPSRSHSASAA